MTEFLLFIVGVSAGVIDTIAGGGGMLTIPALMIGGLPPANALATNKLQSAFGTVSATVHFLRKGHLQWRNMRLLALMALAGSALGTVCVSLVNSAILKNVIPALLFAIALIFLLLPNMGEVTTKRRLQSMGFAVGAVAPIGFYDGFLGPGTGSFFILGLMLLYGQTLQQATIEAKLLNAVTNVTSLGVFLFSGLIDWRLGLLMGVGQVLGAQIGSHLVIAKGSRLIRPMVIVMSLLMSASLAWRYWF